MWPFKKKRKLEPYQTSTLDSDPLDPFQDLPEETQEGIIRGIEDIEAGRYKVIHIKE